MQSNKLNAYTRVRKMLWPLHSWGLWSLQETIFTPKKYDHISRHLKKEKNTAVKKHIKRDSALGLVR